jgi:hypothetical protein
VRSGSEKREVRRERREEREERRDTIFLLSPSFFFSYFIVISFIISPFLSLLFGIFFSVSFPSFFFFFFLSSFHFLVSLSFVFAFLCFRFPSLLRFAFLRSFVSYFWHFLSLSPHSYTLLIFCYVAPSFMDDQLLQV